MSRVKVARPLPECAGCDRPTHRETWLANGGLCRECKGDYAAATVKMTRLPPSPDECIPDATAYVESYRPPVPGQLEIDELEP